MKIIKVLFVLLFLALFTIFAASPTLDESPCEAGAPCARCWCMGDYYARFDDDEPDSENSEHPRNVCKNFCIRSCCKCVEPGGNV